VGEERIAIRSQHSPQFTLKSSRKILEARQSASAAPESDTPSGEFGLAWRRPCDAEGNWRPCDGPEVKGSA
jgi:hypothetical protein